MTTLNPNSVSVFRGPGWLSKLNITAATVVKTGPGRIGRVTVTTAGAAGTISDCTATSGGSGPAAGNLVWTIPATVGIYELDWPVSAGIVVTPGAAQVCAISYS